MNNYLYANIDYDYILNDESLFLHIDSIHKIMDVCISKKSYSSVVRPLNAYKYEQVPNVVYELKREANKIYCVVTKSPCTWCAHITEYYYEKSSGYKINSRILDSESRLSLMFFSNSPPEDDIYIVSISPSQNAESRATYGFETYNRQGEIAHTISDKTVEIFSIMNTDDLLPIDGTEKKILNCFGKDAFLGISIPEGHITIPYWVSGEQDFYITDTFSAGAVFYAYKQDAQEFALSPQCVCAFNTINQLPIATWTAGPPNITTQFSLMGTLIRPSIINNIQQL